MGELGRATILFALFTVGIARGAVPRTLVEKDYRDTTNILRHIEKFQVYRNRSWTNSIVEEVPLSGDSRRLSVTVPIVHVPNGGGATGLGDILLTYRYRLLTSDPIALAPRLTAVLPTGDAKRGLGYGGPGVRLLLPFVVRLSSGWFLVARGGITYVPQAHTKGGPPSPLAIYKASARAVWDPSDHWRTYLEVVGTTAPRKSTLYVKPGARFRFPLGPTIDALPGVSVPIGVGPSAGDLGGLAYVIFEQRVR